MFFRTPKEMSEYEAREKYEMDMLLAEDNGRAEGRAEGIAEGRIEALLETAKNLLKLGLSVEQIKAATHLNDEQLAQLR